MSYDQKIDRHFTFNPYCLSSHHHHYCPFSPASFFPSPCSVSSFYLPLYSTFSTCSLSSHPHQNSLSSSAASFYPLPFYAIINPEQPSYSPGLSVLPIVSSFSLYSDLWSIQVLYSFTFLTPVGFLKAPTPAYIHITFSAYGLLYLLLSWLLWPWRWRQYIPLKHEWTSIRLHGMISQKIAFVKLISITTSNLAMYIAFSHPSYCPLLGVICYQVELCAIWNKREMFMHLINVVNSFYKNTKVAFQYEGGNILNYIAKVYETVACLVCFWLSYCHWCWILESKDKAKHVNEWHFTDLFADV
jgi:hypothetical protein